MKTPEEVKKGLECCGKDGFCTQGTCPYHQECYVEHAIYDLERDALTYIQQLEADNSRLSDTIRNLTDLLNAAHEETAKAKRERDAAVEDISLMLCACEACVHGIMQNGDCEKWNGSSLCSFKWRGVCPENTEVKEDD
jgi:hypothetical protein